MMMNVTYDIPPIQTRRLVVSDIHGCYKTLEVLLKEYVKINQTDHILFLGDYIDRGPSSKKVLDYIIDLQNRGYQIYALRGNHEQELLNSIYRNNKVKVRYLLHLSNSLDLYDKKSPFGVCQTHFEFLNSLAYYFDLKDYYLVHAGFNFGHSNYLEDFNAMLWTREMNTLPSFLKGKKIVVGHTPTPLWYIKRSIQRQDDIIHLDNGCVYNNFGGGLGALLALDLDSLELFVCPNLEA